jgi:hypothetical protein
MPIVGATYNVEVEGIGTTDYTVKVERSTAAFYTPSLRQEVFIMRYAGVLPTLAYPSVYLFVVPMPQEDGSWGYEASSIVMHFAEMSFTISSNHLTLTGLLRFASLADYYGFIIAENFPQMYGYNSTKLNYTLGIPTQPGSVYVIIGGFWSSNATEIVTMVSNGLITDLTRQWMGI